MNGKITAMAIAIAFIWGLSQPSEAKADARVNVKSYLGNYGYSDVVVTHRGRVWTRVRARYGSHLYHVRVNRHGRIFRHRVRGTSRVHYSGDYAHVAVNGSRVRVDAPYTRVRGNNGRYWADSSDARVRVNNQARSVSVHSHGVSVNIAW